MNFAAMTIKKKLYATYSLILCLLIVLGAASIFILRGLSDTTNLLGVNQGGKVSEAGLLNGYTVESVALVRGIILRAQNGDKDKSEGYIKDFGTNESSIAKSIAGLRAIGLNAAGAGQVSELETNQGQLGPIVARYVAQVRGGDFKAAMEIYRDPLNPLLKKIEALSADILKHQRENMLVSNGEAQASVSKGIWIVGVLLTLGMLFGVVVIFIIRGLDAQLRQTVFELTDGSNQLSGAATQVSSSSQSLARETSEQAAMIEETSASAEEINSMSKRNSESARSATMVANEAVESTEASSRAVAECVLAMDKIGDSSSKIAKTLQVIDKIAFQTNILALNAAVEAARAGEAGMGFAVVADEVRNLAQRCAQAAQETSVLIEESLTNSGAGRARMTTLVDSGHKVNSAFAQMKTLVEGIGLSSEEQGRGIDQIGRAINKMEQGTQKSAANAEESAAAAEQLNAQSEALRHTASSLSLMVGGEQDAGGRRPVVVARRSAPVARGVAVKKALRAAPARAAVAAGAGLSHGDDDFQDF